MSAEARVLVVANRTAESPELLDALRTRTMQGPCRFTLLVPSTPHGLTWAADNSGIYFTAQSEGFAGPRT